MLSITPMARMLAWVLMAVLPPAATAQTVSGQISGVVADSQGNVVPGANVELTHDLSKQLRQLKSDGSGSFIFPNVVSGNYSIRVTQPGFKAYSETGINVGAQERVDLHAIKLAVGDVSTTVDVIAETARVATDSSDRSIAINVTQLQDISTAGRQFTDVLRALPGFQVTATADTRGWGNATPGANGGQTGSILVTLDGISSQDSGTFSNSGYLTPSVEAIGEVKVLISNYNAEYGARAAGQVNFSFKSGARDYHGSVYDYWRHESLNAAGFINNMNGVVRGRYRYQNPGVSFGGPLLIPGTSFNRARNRVFFFFSEDYLHNQSVNGVTRYTMPTGLERKGDFSQTVTTQGVRIPIKDPLTGQTFAGNLIPASRIDPVGAALMNRFPMPFTSDPTGQRQYNAQYQNVLTNPREDRILKVDILIGPKTTSYFRLIQDYYGESGYGARLGPSGGGWQQFKNAYALPAAGAAINVIHTLRPNLVAEFTAGVNRSHQVTYPDYPAYANSQLPLKGSNGQVLALPKFFNSNPFNIMPALNMGNNSAQSAGQGIANAPLFGFDSRWPFEGTETMYNVTSNLTWVKGAHNMKAGLYLEYNARGTPNFSTYNAAGTYWFGSDTANPNDSAYPYSNMLLGSVQAYGEDNERLVALGRYHHVEWFAQDTWKVTRRLTLDLGMRFQIIVPYSNKGATLNMFSQEAYDLKRSGQLLYPATVDGQKVALNPLTGATYLFPRQGSFDPASYPAGSSPYSGMQSYQSVFFKTPPVLFGPRVGFAWDAFGDGKMALRGGFGMFYANPMAVDTIANLAATPPGFRAPLFFNTSFSTLLQTQGFFSPQNVNGGSPDYKNPTTYNWSFGIQRALGYGFILDAAYVGNVLHHGMGVGAGGPPTVDGNAVALYTTWSPKGGVNPLYQDPTNATGGLYQTNLIRAKSGGYNGYGAINIFTSAGENNYNALQVQLNRRFGRKFRISGNYTWSKTIVYSRMRWVDDSLNKNVVNRPHAVNLNFGVTIPDGSRLWKNALTKFVLDGWNVNGVGAYFVGTPMTVACASQNVPANLGNYWTGTPTGSVPFRCQMIGPLWLPDGTTPAQAGSKSGPRMWFPINPASFVLPGPNSLGIGNTPPTLTYGPGFENWDLSLFKEFRLGRESRVMQFRVEAFNAFNHFNPGNPNLSLSYNFVSGAQTNANFGSITSAQNSPRKMSLSLRFRF